MSHNHFFGKAPGSLIYHCLHQGCGALSHDGIGALSSLPPLGSTVRIVSVGLPVWPDAEKFIGADCTLCAVFMTGDTQMVAVEHQADAVCCCFVADMVRTPEQAEAEERKSAVSDLAKALARYCSNPLTAAYAVYDDGYRKQVAP